MRDEIADDLLAVRRQWFCRTPIEERGTYLLSSDAIRKRLLDTIACDGADDEIREARFERHKQIQDSNLQRVCCDDDKARRSEMGSQRHHGLHTRVRVEPVVRLEDDETLSL